MGGFLEYIRLWQSYAHFYSALYFYSFVFVSCVLRSRLFTFFLFRFFFFFSPCSLSISSLTFYGIYFRWYSTFYREPRVFHSPRSKDRFTVLGIYAFQIFWCFLVEEAFFYCMQKFRDFKGDSGVSGKKKGGISGTIFS